MSATDTGKHLLHKPYVDVERNQREKKAIGFHATVTQVTGGSLSVGSGSTPADGILLTTAAAKDYGSDSLDNSTGVFTVPEGYGGLWFFGAGCTWGSATGGVREVYVYNNTTSVILAKNGYDSDAGGAATGVLSCGNVVRVAEGDEIICQFLQDTGSGLTISAPYFCGTYLGQAPTGSTSV